MKQYQEAEDGSLVFDRTSIPSLLSSGQYRRVLGEVAAGEAAIDYYEGSDRELADLRQKKIDEFDVAAAAEITNGFTSEALGSAYRYSSDEHDQTNITGNVLDASMGITCQHFCYDSNGDRQLMEHSPEQMIQVGRDLKAHKMAVIVKAGTLKAQAGTATKEGLDAITW